MDYKKYNDYYLIDMVREKESPFDKNVIDMYHEKYISIINKEKV